ncbi:MAG: 4-alpha-glucanotransferase [Tepidisphaeraceae bacterium]
MKPLFGFDRRASGVLLHPTSLPGRHGSGDLGSASREFIDRLADAGQSWWQMLPINPPGNAPAYSPYSCPSSFAGSPWLISLDDLVTDGLLDRRDVTPDSTLRADRVSHAAVYAYRDARLRRAWKRLASAPPKDFAAFCTRHAGWLDDWANFAALRERNRGAVWTKWKINDPNQLDAHDVDRHRFIQWLFFKQWARLRNHARKSGVALIGDVPIFVGHDSADVWAHRELFLLDRRGNPTVVTGCPPDPFSKTGQIWRHAHYDWPKHVAQKFDWWTARFAATFELFDAVRIDHFLGFYRLWAIPAKRNDGRIGKWIMVPGQKLLQTVTDRLGKLPIIAEDLGIVTKQAADLRDRFGFPGMRVLQFGFDSDADFHRPHAWPRKCVAYTGTHDNDTIAGHFAAAKRARPAEYKRAATYAGDFSQTADAMIRLALTSVADTVIIPVQDLLGLDSSSRMNVPATVEDNWAWRMKPGQLTKKHLARLRELTEVSGRLPNRK